MQTTWFRIWTRVAESTSYSDNRYTTSQNKLAFFISLTHTHTHTHTLLLFVLVWSHRFWILTNLRTMQPIKICCMKGDGHFPLNPNYTLRCHDGILNGRAPNRSWETSICKRPENSLVETLRSEKQTKSY